jgi:hypothetical protein
MLGEDGRRSDIATADVYIGNTKEAWSAILSSKLKLNLAASLVPSC